MGPLKCFDLDEDDDLVRDANNVTISPFEKYEDNVCQCFNDLDLDGVIDAG